VEYTGDLPAIVDFYADWCGPCKMVSPLLEPVIQGIRGEIHVYKVNTDEEQEVSSVFGIQSIPTILFIPLEGQPRRPWSPSKGKLGKGDQRCSWGKKNRLRFCRLFLLKSVYGVPKNQCFYGTCF